MIYNDLHKHLQMVLNEQKCRFNPAKMVIDPAKRGISPTKTDQCFTNKWWLNNPKKIRLRWHTYFWSLHRHFLWGLPSQNSYNQTWLADFETINLIYHISYIIYRWCWNYKPPLSLGISNCYVWLPEGTSKNMQFGTCDGMPSGAWRSDPWQIQNSRVRTILTI